MVKAHILIINDFGELPELVKGLVANQRRGKTCIGSSPILSAKKKVRVERKWKRARL